MKDRNEIKEQLRTTNKAIEITKKMIAENPNTCKVLKTALVELEMSEEKLGKVLNSQHVFVVNLN